MRRGSTSSRTSSSSPRRRPRYRSSGACGRWYRVAAMLHRRWFPDHIDGTQVILRRHTRDNLSDFLRWYQDPEVARLTRYQDGPMRPDEIERFFTMRAMGPDSLAMG